MRNFIFLFPSPLNTKKPFFHKLSTKGNILLPKLKMDNVIIKRNDKIKFLGVIDENLTWNDHIDKRQFVQIDDKESPKNDVIYGIPQGSILGPVLFNL